MTHKNGHTQLWLFSTCRYVAYQNSVMVILIDDDFSHLYIPTEQITNVSIFLPINEKSKMAATDKQKSSFR